MRFFTSGFSLSPRPKPASVNSKPELAIIAQSFKGFGSPGKLDRDALHHEVSCSRPETHLLAHIYR
jgi:hypothetical protein